MLSGLRNLHFIFLCTLSILIFSSVEMFGSNFLKVDLSDFEFSQEQATKRLKQLTGSARPEEPAITFGHVATALAAVVAAAAGFNQYRQNKERARRIQAWNALNSFVQNRIAVRTRAIANWQTAFSAVTIPLESQISDLIGELKNLSSYYSGYPRYQGEVDILYARLKRLHELAGTDVWFERPVISAVSGFFPDILWRAIVQRRAARGSSPSR